MSKPYLEITYRSGRPLAGYLYLDRRPGDHSVRTERHGSWIVDFTADGRAIGVEFTQISQVEIDELNRVLAIGCQPPLSLADLAPLTAA